MSVSLPADPVILVIAGLLAAGVLGAAFAEVLRIPGPVLFLLLGMLLGDDGLNLVSLSDPRLAQSAGTVALLLILYQGGLTTTPGDIRRASGAGLALATAGVVLTAVVVAGGAALLLDVDPFTAALIGAVVSSTDAAAVFSVLRRAPLPRRLVALLEVESGANDPLAIMLTVGILELWQATPTPAGVAGFAVVQLLGGLAVGALGGLLAALALNRARLSAGLHPVLALSAAGLVYGAATSVGASGFLAVYVAGVLVGARVPRHRRAIRAFHDGLSNTAEIGLFLLLGLLVFPSRLPGVAGPALALTMLLVFVARPVAVLVCLTWFRFTGRELLLLSWAGLRGAVPIVLATFPFTAGYPDANLIFDTVFFVVLVSVALQGVTVAPLAQRLGLATGRPPTPVAEALPLEGVEADLVEVDVTPDLPIAGRLLREVPLPRGALLTAVMRGTTTQLPTGGTRIQPGDRLLVAMPPRDGSTAEVVAWARGERRAARSYPG